MNWPVIFVGIAVIVGLLTTFAYLCGRDDGEVRGWDMAVDWCEGQRRRHKRVVPPRTRQSQIIHQLVERGRTDV